MEGAGKQCRRGLEGRSIRGLVSGPDRSGLSGLAGPPLTGDGATGEKSRMFTALEENNAPRDNPGTT